MNGKHKIPQAIHAVGGKKPSIMCIACTVDAVVIIATKTASVSKRFLNIVLTFQ
jgi:hypothetical protein